MTRHLDLVRLLSSVAFNRVRLDDRSGVMLDANAIEAYAINQTGMCVVEAIRAGVDDRAGLVRRLTEEFDVDAATAGADIDEFLLDLLDALGGEPPADR